ncbi:MAG: DEAD/DEAH box helicase [Anaerolineae bacterium]|nr:DEAD/DEAH box helicase [Anaerolineae bacterium]
MSNGLKNPISMSFNLLQNYRALLNETLQRSELSHEDIKIVLNNIEVDSGILFSLNRKYQQGATSFRQFCSNNGISDRLADMLDLKRLFIHQEQAIRAILAHKATIISTGTGSGKTESFLIPILDSCLKEPGNGVKAIIIYPMNALANDQLERLARYTDGTDITYGIYVGSTPRSKMEDAHEKPVQLSANHMLYRRDMQQCPPNILITNYVMLDWMLTDSQACRIFTQSRATAKYVVLDEIHTYRGNKATHLMCLLRRLKALLSEAVLPIGASATLRKADRQTGYLGGDSLDAFIKPLLGVEEYQLIQPTFLDEPELSPGPTPVFSADITYDSEATVPTPKALHHVSKLTGENYSEFDLVTDDFTETKIYRTLQRDQFVLAIKQALAESACSFLDLVKLFRQVYPQSPTHKAEEIVQAYLSAIAYINQLGNQSEKSTSLLDFRIHLFLKDIGGYLKRCMKCKKYHSGLQEFCQDCGFPLFCVYKDDIRRCIGKVTDGRLKYELRPESDDQKNSFYVLVELFDTLASSAKENDTLRFIVDSNTIDGQLILSFKPDGPFHLSLLPVVRYNEVEPLLIDLVEGAKDYQYLHHLVKSILDHRDRADKKLLGFVDNREKASRLSSVLQDEFSDQFFEEYLKLNYPVGRKLDLVDTLAHLQAQIPLSEKLTPIEKKLFEELPIWYARYISMPSRIFEYKTGLLKLKSDKNFDSLQRELLDIFLAERAINKQTEEFTEAGLKLESEVKFIRFQRYWATSQRGIRVVAEEESTLPHFPSLSLSKGAREYADFVHRYDTEITPAIRSLIDDGIIMKYTTEDQKTHYALNPRQIYLQPGQPRHDSYEALKNDLLLTADLHSSELSTDRRQMVESDFKSGKLNFLLATPTLEMGIDIGQLQSVLLVGVPPLPSNYAQRAGRAGRTQGDNYALLITYCSAGNNHDMFYFSQPCQMINGVISPPTFNPTNAEVIKKHINAWVLADEIQSRQQLRGFLRSLDNGSTSTIVSQTQPIFGDIFKVEDYLIGQEFKEIIHNLIERAQSQSRKLRQFCYGDGIFPDYMFRRDMIQVIDRDTFEERREKGDVFTGRDLGGQALSEREPELAYYKFAPGETVYMAGGVHKILPDSDGRHLLESTSMPVYQYDYFLSEAVVGYASKSKVYTRYQRTQRFDGDPEITHDCNKIINLAYYSDCDLMLRNEGVKKAGKVEPFPSEKEHFAIGYNLKRQAIILEFDGNVCANARLYLSLVSALDRTIKDMYGLDESELRLLVDVMPHDQAPDTSKIWVILYDFDGNGNIPLRRIFNDFAQINAQAYHRLTQCDCESGCYQCVKSYNTHFYADNVDKQTALMFLGYLLGKNRFEPKIALLPPIVDQADLVLTLVQRGSVFTVTVQPNDNRYEDENRGSQNSTIFQLLCRAICAEFQPTFRTLQIQTRLDYVVNAINRGELEKDKAAFAQLQFQLLRFAAVTAVKG